MVGMSRPSLVIGTMSLTCAFVCMVAVLARAEGEQSGWAVVAMTAIAVAGLVWIVETSE